MLLLATASLLLSTLAPTDVKVPSAPPPATQTYKVKQTVVLSEIPEGTKKVRLWVAVPEDDRAQEVLDISVASAPGPWSLEREADQGNRFLYVEVPQPKAGSLETVVEFTLRRRSIFVAIDPTKVGLLGDDKRKLFSEELRLDSPHMLVTPDIRAMADKVCGKEANIAVQANLLLEHVASVADHYSKDKTKPNCGLGDAATCLEQGGGCCTDLHSLFIALARARGIPARLQMGYRMKPENSGKEVDPGYRCWVEYFVPGYGWVPSDIVEADAAEGDARLRWLTGLSERRLWLNAGREFTLNPAQAGGPVNHMSIAYAEIDGKPARILPEGELKPQLTRKVQSTDLPDQESTALGARGL
jgi:transglutaminase-like putative cysteine protease